MRVTPSPRALAFITQGNQYAVKLSGPPPAVLPTDWSVRKEVYVLSLFVPRFPKKVWQCPAGSCPGRRIGSKTPTWLALIRVRNFASEPVGASTCRLVVHPTWLMIVGMSAGSIEKAGGVPPLGVEPSPMTGPGG